MVITLHKMNIFAALCVVVLLSVTESQPLGDTAGSLPISWDGKCPHDEPPVNHDLCIFAEGIGRLVVDKERRRDVKEKGFEALIRTLRYRFIRLFQYSIRLCDGGPSK